MNPAITRRLSAIHDDLSALPAGGGSRADGPLYRAPAALPGWPAALRQPMAAAYLGISVRTLRRLLHDGALRTVIIGGCAVIERTELDRYLTEQAARQTPPRLRRVR